MSSLELVVKFIYICYREETRSPIAKAKMVSSFTPDQITMVARLVTAKSRRGWKTGSVIGKHHAAKLETPRAYKPINNDGLLEAAITEATIYHSVTNELHRMFLHRLFFGKAACWIGPAWIRANCPNPGQWLFPQVIPGVDFVDFMRPTTIATIDGVPANAIVQIKYDGRRSLIAIYKKVLRFISRGGTDIWASRDVLTDRYSGRSIDRPDNPGKLLYVLDGELVATNELSRLAATDSVGVGTAKPGVAIVFDCLYAPRFKIGNKQYRNEDYAHLYAHPLSLRLAIAEVIVRQYTGDAVYSDKKLTSSRFLWLARTVQLSDLPHVATVEEGGVVKSPTGCYSSIHSDKPTKATKWYKYKKRTESLDVRIVRGHWLPSDPSTPGSLEMLLRGANEEYVSIKYVSGLSAKYVAYLYEVGIQVSPDGFTMDRPIFAEVLIDCKDGVYRHPRIVRFRELDEGFTVSSIADIV